MELSSNLIPTQLQHHLTARDLHTAFPVLSSLLSPGMRVLDVGCGPGSITRGIAEQVGPAGQVLGVDRSPHLIEQAKEQQGDVPWLHFEVQDACDLHGKDFDVVCAARLLLWISDIRAALQSMLRVLKPGGLLVVLDNTRERITWTPSLSDHMQAYFQAYQDWRASQGLNNQIADDLPALLAAFPVEDVQVVPCWEHTERGHPLFQQRGELWMPSVHSRASQVVQDGFFTGQQREKAEQAYQKWLHQDGEALTTHLATVVARKRA